MSNDKNVYKKIASVARKSGQFCPFRYEKQMEKIEEHLAKDLSDRPQRLIMDACCGQGRLLYFLKVFAPEQNYFGFDYMEDFVKDAKKQFHDDENIQIEQADIFGISDHSL